MRILKMGLNGFDWSSIPWDQIGTETGSLVGNWLGTNDTSTPSSSTSGTTTASGSTAAGGSAAGLPAAKDNTMLYIGLGVGGLGLLLLFNQFGNNKPKPRR